MSGEVVRARYASWPSESVQERWKECLGRGCVSRFVGELREGSESRQSTGSLARQAKEEEQSTQTRSPGDAA